VFKHIETEETVEWSTETYGFKLALQREWPGGAGGAWSERR